MKNAQLFLSDPYSVNETAVIKQIIPGSGLVLEKTLFYATSGGQPSDRGRINFNDETINISEAKKIENGDILLISAEAADKFEVGTIGSQEIDWELRYRHMRMHTALHLLSVVIPLPVSGGQIGEYKSRLDFNMPDPIEDKQLLEDQLNQLIQKDFSVEQEWISETELDAKSELVKTMSVSPPRGVGDIRLVRIGSDGEQIDLQPCGGTHVKKTGEIGEIKIGKIEKKGKNNRRVNIHFL